MVTQTLNPNGNTATINLTPVPGTYLNWQCVSSLHQHEPDDAATNVENTASGSSSRKDIYTLQPNTIPSGSIINSVTIYYRCAKFGLTAACSASPNLIVNGVDNAEGSNTLTSTWTTFHTPAITKNPNTGLPWQLSDLAGLGVGINLTNANGSTTVAECTWIYVVIDYTPPTRIIGMLGDGLTFVTAMLGRGKKLYNRSLLKILLDDVSCRVKKLWQPLS